MPSSVLSLSDALVGHGIGWDVWLSLLIYMVGAGLWDLRERRIPNAWTLSWLAGIIIIQGFEGHIGSSLVGAGIIAVTMLVPTVLGIWGQGDWKMSIVFGSAIGALPTLLIWLLAFILAGVIKKVTFQLSLRYMAEDVARSVPVAVPVAISTFSAFIVVVITKFMLG